MSIEKILEKDYIFVNHNLCHNKPIGASLEFTFIGKHESQLKESYVAIGNGNAKVSAHFRTLSETGLDFEENGIIYQGKQSSYTRLLPDKHPYSLIWEISSGGNPKIAQEYSYELYHFGPTSSIAGITWGNKPTYDFWHCIKKPIKITTDLNNAISIWESDIKRTVNNISLHLDVVSYEKIIASNPTISEVINLEFNYKSEKERFTFSVKSEYKIVISGKLITIKSLRLSRNNILYQYGTSLWPHRYSRNTFGGGQQIFYVLGSLNEFFITEGGHSYTKIRSITNISIVN